MSSDLENPPASATLSRVATETSPEWMRGAITDRDSPSRARVDLPGAERSLVTGHLVGFDDEGRILFAAEHGGEAMPVGIALSLGDGALVRAVRRQSRALVARTTDPAPRWLLVGLVRERVSAAARDARPGRLEVAVDGEKVKLEAEHDIELRCGQASITLRYDGRIELRGTHILSASRGPNRVKGATIALN